MRIRLTFLRQKSDNKPILIVDCKMISNNRSYLLFFCLKRIVFAWGFLFVAVSFANAQSIIIQQPRDTTICRSENAASFSVKLDATYMDASYQRVYQWYQQKGDQVRSIPGSNSPSYSANEAAQYYCVVRVVKSGTSKTETSTKATLTITDIPSINNMDIHGVCNKSTLTATVQASYINDNGSPLVSTGTYAWKLSGAAVGSDSRTLNIYVDSTKNGAKLEFFVTNGCGTNSIYRTISVYETPPPPTVNTRDYCHGETAVPLSIGENNPATWYTQKTGGTGSPVPPTPDTNTDGTQTWWVSQTVVYSAVSCEGYRAEATVKVTPISDIPVTTTSLSYCLNEPGITLSATGVSLKWYNGSGQLLPGAPQINTNIPGTQLYYVTQTEPNKCESPKVEITVEVKDRADQQLIQVPEIPNQCPYSRVTLQAFASVPNPVFRWYEDSQKSILLHTGDTYLTDELTVTTPYYITLEYTGFCESIYPKPLMVNVGDVTPPEITAPPDVIVSTNDGVCYATNVQTGTPEVRDNCTPANRLRVYTDPTAPTMYQLGSMTIVWWARDTVGNKEKATQTITVVDKEFPKGTCPDDIEIVVDPEVTSAVATYSLSYTDNCDVVKITRESGLASGSVFPLGETIVRYAIADTANNVTICEFKVVVRHPYRALDVALRVSSYEICPGEPVTITPVVSGGTEKYIYTWSPRPWTKPVLEDYPLTTTNYELKVDDGITSLTKSVVITVLEAEPVKLAYDGRQDEILEGNEVVVKATSGFAGYKFLLNHEVVQEAGLNDQIAFTAELGVYIVQVFATDVNYCVVQDQLTINVDGKKLPNVFTPNRDGKNEIFLEGYDLMVFSRSGELLYKGIEGWDGTYKGKIAPQGTYLYVVKRTMVNGEQRVYKGTVTLKL